MILKKSGVRLLAILLIGLGLPFTFLGCGRSRSETTPHEKLEPSMTSRPIADVLAEHTPRLMAMPGVVGTAEGREEGRPCILVFVASDSPELRASIPSQIEGHPVKIQVTGEITPLHRND